MSSGTFTINGTEVAFNVAVDKISDVVARITALTGVQARFSEAQPMLQLAPVRANESIQISDHTGLLDAFGIRSGTHAPTRVSKEFSSSASITLAAAMEEINGVFGEVLQEQDGYRSTALVGFRAAYRSLTTDFTTRGFGTILDRLALAPITDASLLSGAQASQIRQQLMKASADRVAALLAGTAASTTDGFFEKFRGLLATTISSLESGAERLETFA